MPALLRYNFSAYFVYPHYTTSLLFNIEGLVGKPYAQLPPPAPLVQATKIDQWRGGCPLDYDGLSYFEGQPQRLVWLRGMKKPRNVRSK